MTKSFLGIIGGSGVYHLPGIEDLRDTAIESPWGAPSDVLRIGHVGTTPVAILARHGRGHRYSPSDINYRANIDVLKRAGVTDIVSISAVGSLREDIAPGAFVIVDQFIDRTVRRETSFFSAGCAAHVSMAHPISPRLADRVEAAAVAERIDHRRGGTYVVIEGPQFSSLAESRLYRIWGADVVGMTAMPEAKLAREAELSYATIAMVTDFDCWHPDHDAVSVTSVLQLADDNRDKVTGLLLRLAKDFPDLHEPCPIGSDSALDDAIMTAPDARDPELLAKLDAIAGRVLGRA
jgi:5'-methylthioadenosine phosphorylase